ncbi:hypothetical protein VNO78_06559 [Psophocarpus tetragonolobus]|uniref:Uncharacterized protein n=1 Tax=Psophocarpus tetragonolobus TaxID=3891 RepID=A0AAN9SVB5_PSOTE
MNPYDEKRLRDEVIFLHALWHQGPPPPLPPPAPPLQNPIVNFHLPFPSSSQPYIPQHTWRVRPHPHHPPPAHTISLPFVSFKKKRKNKKKKKHKVADPGPPWPCPVRSDPRPNWPLNGPRSDSNSDWVDNKSDPTMGWDGPNSDSNPGFAGQKSDQSLGWAGPKVGPTLPPEVSPEEKEKLLAMNLQNKACKALKQFLTSHDDDGSDEEEDDDDRECEEFENFFVGVFMEDNELRSYYQRCYESGEFSCFVCGAIGKKNSGKRFKDCAALVQHSMSILRTLKKRAHRGFGIALCKVLGWDVDRLPTIVIKGTPLGVETVKPAEAEGEPKEKVEDDGQAEDHVQGVDQSVGQQ